MKIICIGRNFADHSKELNNPVPEKPIFFLKPDSALLLKDRAFFIPEFSDEIHHEVEVVVRINRIGKHIQEKFAHKYYEEVALGIDFTARDLQAECKQKGLPWEMSKAFDQSAVLSPFINIKEYNLDVNAIAFHMTKNGDPVQAGNTRDMLFSVDQIIAYVSQYMMLKIGDLIYLGTPAGVGKVAIGDELKGFIGERQMFRTLIK